MLSGLLSLSYECTLELDCIFKTNPGVYLLTIDFLQLLRGIDFLVIDFLNLDFHSENSGSDLLNLNTVPLFRIV